MVDRAGTEEERVDPAGQPTGIPEVSYPGVSLDSALGVGRTEPPRRRGGGTARRLGSRYLLHERLGRGAMGEVFRGSVRGSRDTVAVKVLRPELSADPETVARFLQERSILTELRHPHIVAVRDLVVEGETLAIVMDLVVGDDLRRHLRRQHTVIPATAVDLVVQLLDGLEAVHEAGVVHRDLKPENVLLEQRGDNVFVRLADFGVSRIASAALSRLTGAIGTPEYMAPELLRGEAASQASDLYAVGIILYELLAGHTPFAGGDVFAVIRGHGERVPTRVDGIPDQLWGVITYLLEKDPTHRPKSALEVGVRLRRLLPALVGDGEAAVGDLDEVREDPGATRRVTRMLTAAIPEEAGSTPRISPPPPTSVGASPTRLRRFIGAIGLAAVLVAVATFSVVRLTGGHAATPAATRILPTFSFAPYTEDGLLVSRTWTLAAAGSTLGVTLQAINPTSQPIGQPALVEVIPKSLAASASRITPGETSAVFTVLQPDPALRFSSAEPLGSDGLVVFTYQVALASSSATSSNRLSGWANDQATAQTQWVSTHPTDAQVALTALTVSPATLDLVPGTIQRVVVSGQMSNGKAAPAALSSLLVWSSSAPTIAQVAAGEVEGLKSGVAIISAAAGTVVVKMRVTVGTGTSATPSISPNLLTSPSARPGVPSILPTRRPAGGPHSTSTPTPSPPSISRYDTSFEKGLPQGWNGAGSKDQVLCGSAYAPESGNCIDRGTYGATGSYWGPYYEFPFQILPGQTVHVSMWLRGGSNCPSGQPPSGGAGDGQSINLAVGAGGAGPSNTAFSNLVAGGGWTQLSVSVVVPSGENGIWVTFYSGCYIDVDNLTFSVS